MPLVVVFSSPDAVVTDLGEPIEVRDPDTGELIGTVGRYGVWRAGHCVEVFDDVDAAIASARGARLAASINPRSSGLSKDIAALH